MEGARASLEIHRTPSRGVWRSLVLCLGFLSCQGPSEIEVGPVCPLCGPSSGGETGDFGPGVVSCAEYLEPAAAEQASAAGLDTDEFDARLSRNMELPMSWAPVDWGSQATVKARGYDEHTQLIATLTRTGPLQYQRLIQDACAGTCGCSPFVEASIRIELETADRAVRATLQGSARQRHDESSDHDSDPYFISINAQADLRDVEGTLRFRAPGKNFHGVLTLGARLTPDGGQGSLSVRLQVERDQDRAWDGTWITREQSLSVHGVFPSAAPGSPRR